MNEEKIIAMLRYFGMVRTRRLPNPYQMMKIFDIQWPTAKRWHSILVAMPEELADMERLKDLLSKYRECDIDRARKKNSNFKYPKISMDETYGTNRGEKDYLDTEKVFGLNPSTQSTDEQLNPSSPETGTPSTGTPSTGTPSTNTQSQE